MDVLFTLAVLPAAVLLWYVWKMDPIEKEPPSLLLKLLFLGMLSTIPAALLEMVFAGFFDEGSFGLIAHDLGVAAPSALTGLVIQNFVGVALIEEGCKYFFLRGQTWRNPEFDYVFDGIVYAAFVGLGFAIAENINYVFTYGFATGVVRAFTAIPGHCVFAVFMGYFYGKAKRNQATGHSFRGAANTFWALVIPIFCHGTYDSLASIESDSAQLVFFAFLIIVFAIGMRLIKRTSAQAERIR